MTNTYSTFKEQLESKKSANFMLLIIMGIVTFGLSLYCFITNNYGFSNSPMLLVLLFGAFTLFFVFVLNRIKKYEKYPENLIVYDSFITNKKTEQTKYHYCYSLFVKKDTGKSFKLIVNPQDFNSYHKNAKILAIKDFLLGGFIVNEEECKEYGFKKINVEREI